MKRGKGKGKRPENKQSFLSLPFKEYPLIEDQSEQAQNILQPEKVMELLKRKGIDISYEQAELILQFLHQLSNSIVSKFLQNEQNS